jgi:hypothetical protein
MDLSLFVAQPAKPQNPFNGELSHGVVKKEIHQEVQVGCTAAVGQGVSIGARALEVNANVLHRWRRPFRQGPGKVFWQREVAFAGRRFFSERPTVS